MIFLSLILFVGTINLDAGEIAYELGNQLDKESFRRISIEAMYECYKQIPANELSLDESMGLKESLERWTDDFIENFSKNLELPNCSFQLATAKKEGVSIGFAIFEMEGYPNSVYLSELVVDPHFQRQGVGRNLVFSILKKFSETEKIVLITRKANFQACAFYPAIGFVDSDYMHPGYDPRVYKGFEFKNR